MTGIDTESEQRVTSRTSHLDKVPLLVLASLAIITVQVGVCRYLRGIRDQHSLSEHTLVRYSDLGVWPSSINIHVPNKVSIRSRNHSRPSSCQVLVGKDGYGL